MCLLITLAFTALFFVLMRLDRGNKFSVRPVFITFLCVGVVGAIIFLLMWTAPRDGYERSRKFTENFAKND